MPTSTALNAQDIKDRDLVCCYCGKSDGLVEACDNGNGDIFAYHCNDYATLIPRSDWDAETASIEMEASVIGPKVEPEWLSEGPCSCGGPYGGDHLGWCCIWTAWGGK